MSTKSGGLPFSPRVKLVGWWGEDLRAQNCSSAAQDRDALQHSLHSKTVSLGQQEFRVQAGGKGASCSYCVPHPT